MWSLLAEKHSYAEAAEKKYYANGAKGLLLYRDGVYGGEAVAAAEAVVLHENRLISMKAMLLHEDEETVKAFVEALLFEEAESTLCS